MQQNNMNDHFQWAGTPNALATAGTIALFVISKITLSDVALGATILAALTTAALNIQKFVQGRKGKKIE